MPAPHDFIGESHPETEPTIADVLNGAQYDGYPLKIMTLGALLQQAHQGNIVNYVWAYEGQYRNNKWKFHPDTVIDGGTPVDAPTAPLMVDASSARAFKLVYEAINETNQAKTREFVASRGLFVWCMDTLVWPNVGFGKC